MGPTFPDNDSHKEWVEQHKKPWPPDDVLILVGVTRDEWDKMSDDIQYDRLGRHPAIIHALMKAARRSVDE